MSNIALTSLTGGAPNSLDGLPTASGQILSGTIKSVLYGDLEAETIDIASWVLLDGVKEEDGIKHVRPDDFDPYTNARTWVNVE